MSASSTACSQLPGAGHGKEQMPVARADAVVLVGVRTPSSGGESQTSRARSTAASPSSETQRAVATEIESGPRESSAGTACVPVPVWRGANGPTPSAPSRFGCSRRSATSNVSAGANVSSTASPPTRPDTATCGRTSTM